MNNIGLNELRNMFLNFFETKQHLRLDSFSLIPQNDTSLLLINSGMAPLKQYFLGKEEPPNKRVTTCQKCIRTPDIDRVGKTARHATFFEMLGNFSFGDYFKDQAISWAWEFVTKILNLPEDKLWISVYQDDDEALKIWNEKIGVSLDRIVKLGKEDNFWEIGTGPCGPCSEIYFDRGEDQGCKNPNCKPGCDCDRFVEFWNLVFTQFTRDDNGNYTNLENPNIDTGMGLERLACIVQGVDSLFEVDTVKKILDYVCKAANIEYGKTHKNDISIRIITDHIRSTVMLISDGVIPSNEGRGYVLRRLLRRAARHAKLLGIDRIFLSDLSDIVIKECEDAYPELLEKRDYIHKIIKIEEEKFQQTIDQGISILNEFITNLKSEKKSVLEGSKAFKLHDTYGFPIEITKEIAEENGISVDENGFRAEMEVQRNKAREASKEKDSVGWDDENSFNYDIATKTEFTGYEKNQENGQILGLFDKNKEVYKAHKGQDIIVFVDKTPFYGESGGQIGDTGYIENENLKIRIKDCKKTPSGIYKHVGVIETGEATKGQTVSIRIDTWRRLSIARNHTATHLLHKALKEVLGEHVNQAGSLVQEDRLRFDFTHFSPVSPDELKKVENKVNMKILENINVNVDKMSLQQAKQIGAMALFNEKYGDTVRVIKIGDYSKELCGGTHVNDTSEILLFKIISETGVAAGVRRIEALTGKSAVDFLNNQHQTLSEICEILKTNPKDCKKKIESLLIDFKNVQREKILQKRNRLSIYLGEIAKDKKQIKGIDVIIKRFDNEDIDSLRNISDLVKSNKRNCVVVLASRNENKIDFVVSATKSAVKQGIHSGNIVKEIANITGGRGGGRPDMAQAGGKDVSKLDEALEYAEKVIEDQIKGQCKNTN